MLCVLCRPIYQFDFCVKLCAFIYQPFIKPTPVRIADAYIEAVRLAVGDLCKINVCNIFFNVPPNIDAVNSDEAFRAARRFHNAHFIPSMAADTQKRPTAPIPGS